MGTSSISSPGPGDGFTIARIDPRLPRLAALAVIGSTAVQPSVVQPFSQRPARTRPHAPHTVGRQVPSPSEVVRVECWGGGPEGRRGSWAKPTRGVSRRGGGVPGTARARWPRLKAEDGGSGSRQRSGGQQERERAIASSQPAPTPRRLACAPASSIRDRRSAPGVQRSKVIRRESRPTRETTTRESR